MPSSDIAFTASVKSMQARRGSREAYARMEARGGFQTKITPDLVDFLTEVDTAYLATTNSAGQPYVQHRGGPKGFICALDETTLGFADYAGNGAQNDGSAIPTARLVDRHDQSLAGSSPAMTK